MLVIQQGAQAQYLYVQNSLIQVQEILEKQACKFPLRSNAVGMLQRCLTNTDKIRNVEKINQNYFLDRETRMPHSLLRTPTCIDTANCSFNKHLLAK